MVFPNKNKIKAPKLLKGLYSLIALGIFLVMFISAAIVNDKLEQLVEKRTTEYAKNIVKVVSAAAANPVQNNDIELLQLMLEEITKDPYIENATIYAENGQIIVKQSESPQLGNLINLESQSIDNEGDRTIEQTLDANNVGKEPASSSVDNVEDYSDNSFAENKTIENQESENQTTENQTTENQTSNNQHIYSPNEIIQIAQQMPFIDKIKSTHGDTIGWFEITLSKHKLENSFRRSLKRSRNYVVAMTILLLLGIGVICYRYNKQVSNLTQYAHRLLQLNAPQMPRSKTQWIESVRNVCETKFENLAENNLSPTNDIHWIASRRESETLFCYCQFAMDDQENEQTAQTLQLAETYLQQAVRSHGLQTQGNILSGCLIPMFARNSLEDLLPEALALIEIINQLFESLPLKIATKAFVGCGSILVLENERTEITGVSLSNRLADRIYKLSPKIDFGDTACITFELSQISKLGKFKQLENEDNSLCYLLEKLDPEIEQQVARQINYIKSQI